MGKFGEFKQLFAQYGSDLEATHFDLKEIDSDHVHVVAHKASQLGENIIVDDSSLEIEGAEVGINVRWLLDHLKDYVDHHALWVVLLAYHHGNEVYIFRGSVPGKIVYPRGTTGYGFDPVFLPDGCYETLAESKSDQYSARAKAVEALLKGEVWAKHPVIKNWEGPWQNS